jgi:hypothetical protein
MEAATLSEPSVNFNENILRCIPEGCHLHVDLDWLTDRSVAELCYASHEVKSILLPVRQAGSQSVNKMFNA